MNAFHRLCRNLGLMIHHIGHPSDDQPVIRQTTRQQSKETSVAPNLLLRRTTIEEIEFRPTSTAGQSPSKGF